MATKKTKLEPNHARIPQALWDKHCANRRAREAWEAAEARSRKEIEALLGDNEIGELPDGTVVVSWKFGKSGRFQQKAFQEAHPDLFAQFVEQKPGRTMTLPGYIAEGDDSDA